MIVQMIYLLFDDGQFFYKILNCSDDISLFVVIPIAILNFQMLLIETGDLRHGFDQ